MQQAVIFGAGKIARGFVGHLLQVSGIPFTFIEKNPDLVRLINTRGRYHVEVMGDPSLNVEVTDAKAICLQDHEAVAEAWAQASIAFTCVGGKNLKELADHLADIIPRRLTRTSARANLITCENWKEPASVLRACLLEVLSPTDATAFQAQLGLSEAVVMRSAVEPTVEQITQDPLWVNVQNFWELPVDRSRVVGDPPSIVGVQYIENFSGFLERKFYTYNAANGTAAYLGYLRGHRYIFEAAHDPVIAEALDGVYRETGAALIAKHGLDPEVQAALISSSLRKLRDRNIIDYIERNARDPLRKLGPNDRLVGSARLAMSYGQRPYFLARSIAAAIHYDEPSDPIAQELAHIRMAGIDDVLAQVCQLDPREPLAEMVKNAVAELKGEGVLV